MGLRRGGGVWRVCRSQAPSRVQVPQAQQQVQRVSCDSWDTYASGALHEGFCLRQAQPQLLLKLAPSCKHEPILSLRITLQPPKLKLAERH